MATTLRNILTHNHGSHNGDGRVPKKTPVSPKANADQLRGKMARQSSQVSVDMPPTPPRKDSAASFGDKNDYTGDTSSFYQMRPAQLSRAGSIYSLSRASFTSQIGQLTAIRLPDAVSLSASIASIPTATIAAKALGDAADQMHSWMQKASDVLQGLDASDDADWAAAAGREGVSEVDAAISKFEVLVNTYVTAVEELQLRADATSVPPADMQMIAGQVDKTIGTWQGIKQSLRDIKRQVELAMEFEELTNTVFEDVGNEIDALSKAMFEMEERRHWTAASASVQDKQVDLGELENMVRNAPKGDSPKSYGFGDDLATPTDSSAASDDAALLGVFARMQPLKANLEFLPMRISTFAGRARTIFPSACIDLEGRRDSLEQQFARLEADAESLRKEVGEDRWNLVFRNAGKQAIKMIESVDRSLAKLDESLSNDTALQHSPATLKKIGGYHAKTQHVCPAIERVLAIVERGVRERLTVNGEILRLRADIRAKWQTLQIAISSMNAQLDEYAATNGNGGNGYGDADGLDATLLSGSDEDEASPSVRRRAEDLAVGKTRAAAPVSRSGPAQGPGHGRRPLSISSTTSTATSSAAPHASRRLSKPPPPPASARTSSRLGPRASLAAQATPQATPKKLLPRVSGLDLRSLRMTSPSRLASPGPHAARAVTSPAPAPAATPADHKPRWSYNKTSGDYDVGTYYRQLMSKGSRLSSRRSMAGLSSAYAQTPSRAASRLGSRVESPAPRNVSSPVPGRARESVGGAGAPKTPAARRTSQFPARGGPAPTPANRPASRLTQSPEKASTTTTTAADKKSRRTSMLPLPVGGPAHSPSHSRGGSGAGPG